MTIQENSRISAMRWIFFIAGAAAVFAYAYVVIEPELIYHAQGRMIEYEHFEFNMEFFENTFFAISGPINYLSAFLAQLFYYPLAGSAIISGLCLVLCVLTYKIMQRSGVLEKIPAIALIPAILMLVSYNRYRNHTITFISTIVAIAVFLLYDKTKKRNIPTRVCVFIVLFFLLYWLSGQACLLFSVLCAFSKDSKSKVRMAVFFLFFASAFYCVCNYLLKIDFPLSQIEVSARDGQDRYVNNSYYLCLFTIASIVLWGTLGKSFGKVKKSNKKAVEKPKIFATVSLLVINVLIVSAVSYAAMVPSFYRSNKHLLKVGHYSVAEQWDEMIAYCKKNPVHSKHYLQLNDLNYALFKNGRLLDDLFEFEQNHKAILLTVDDSTRQAFYRRTRVMNELGYAGIAQKFAHRMLTLNSNEPEILHWLASIYLAKDSPTTATHFLNKLKKNIIYKDQAERTITLIENGTYSNHLASSVADDDQINYSFNTEVFFGNLLRKNPENKMALDYMMAFFLLTKQRDKLVENAPLLLKSDYQKLPRAVKQAIIVHKLAKEDKYDISSYDISDEELNHARNFFLAINSKAYKFNADYRTKIVNQYKNTYYYYHAFTKFGPKMSE